MVKFMKSNYHQELINRVLATPELKIEKYAGNLAWSASSIQEVIDDKQGQLMFRVDEVQPLSTNCIWRDETL